MPERKHFFPRGSNLTTHTLLFRSAQSFHLNMVSDSLGVAANQVYDDDDDDEKKVAFNGNHRKMLNNQKV